LRKRSPRRAMPPCGRLLRFPYTSEVPGNHLIGNGPVQPRVLLHRLPRRSLAEAPTPVILTGAPYNRLLQIA
jgi:hypothetical protein